MSSIFFKRHFWDILLFLGVFAVFFLTGSPKKTVNDSSLIVGNKIEEKVEILEEPLETADISNPPIVPPTNIATLPTEQDIPPSAPNNVPVVENAQTTNPYAVLMNRANQNPGNESPSIQKSLNNLTGQAPSTEALIERNSYFKKLSEQLKDLQGNVNTDEEKPKDTNNNANAATINGPPSNPLDQNSDEDEMFVPELDDDLALPGQE